MCLKETSAKATTLQRHPGSSLSTECFLERRLGDVLRQRRLVRSIGRIFLREESENVR